MQPQYPVYPQQQPAYPVQQYAPPPPQNYYPPQPAPYYPPAPPARPPAVAGSLDDFFDQPSTGSKAWVFKDRPIGTRYAGIVARPVGKSDIRHQASANGQLAYYPDGRPKFVMVVPMLVQPTQEFPEGQASWWVKGQARDELVRAMAEVGAPAGPPEAGAAIDVTLVGHRSSGPGLNPAFQYRIRYQRPQGAVTPAGVQVGQVQAPAFVPGGPIAPPQQQSAPPMMGYGPSGQDYQHPVPPQYAQAAPPPTQAEPPAQQPVPIPPPAAPPVMAPNSLNAEQQALLAQLTGS